MKGPLAQLAPEVQEAVFRLLDRLPELVDKLPPPAVKFLTEQAKLPFLVNRSLRSAEVVAQPPAEVESQPSAEAVPQPPAAMAAQPPAESQDSVASSEAADEVASRVTRAVFTTTVADREPSDELSVVHSPTSRVSGASG